jgi:hypothetical protein
MNDDALRAKALHDMRAFLVRLLLRNAAELQAAAKALEAR